MDQGRKIRQDILEAKFTRDIFPFAAKHGWVGSVAGRAADSDYIIAKFERREDERRVALLYSAQTASRIYKRLDGEVEVIFVQGSPASAEQYTRGVGTPVRDIAPTV